MYKRLLLAALRLIFVSLAVLLPAAVHVVDAQQAIFLLRHAEQALDVDDPPLTEVGQRRAIALASLMKDAGVNVIYSSGIRRTTETAEPLAKALNIEIKTYPRADIVSFVDRLRAQHPHDRVLIVSQSLRVSRWLKALGHPVDITIGPKDYDNLFVIIPKSEGSPFVLRLRY